MTSAIDPTKPPSENPKFSEMRSNFAAAKDEIEALQASVDQKLDIVDVHRTLTVLDENANTVVIDLVNNALPVLDENGDEFFIELTSVENITGNDGGASEVISYSDLNLYATSSKVQSIVMTAPEYNVFLPNATLLSRGGPKFVIKNNGTYTFVVKDFNGVSLAALGSGKIASFFLAENSTSSGHWLSGNDNITAFSNTLSPGAEFQLKTHQTSVVKTILLSSTQALMVFKDGANTLKAYLIFISGDEITTGDILTITTDASGVGFDLEKISSSQALVFYGSSSSNAAQAVTLNVSGSSLSAGTILSIHEGVEDLTTCLDLTLINSTDILATVDIVSHGTSNRYCRAYILRITGTSITAGSSLDIEFSSGSTAATKAMLREVSAGKFVLLYAHYVPFIRCCILEVTDLSLSKGANLTVASTNSSADIKTSEIICLSATRILVAYTVTSVNKFELIGVSGNSLTMLNTKNFYLGEAHRVKFIKLSASKILILFSRSRLLYAIYSAIDDIGYMSDLAPIFASGFSNFTNDNDYPVALRISDSELLCSADTTNNDGGSKTQHCILNIAADFPYTNPITFTNNYLTTESIKSFFLDAERFLIVGVSNSNYSKAFVLTKI
jgi:hypothetical protein